MNDRAWAINVNYLTGKYWHNTATTITAATAAIAAARAMRKAKKNVPKGKRISEFWVKGVALKPMPKKKEP
jgi:hypothetical protein